MLRPRIAGCPGSCRLHNTAHSWNKRLPHVFRLSDATGSRSRSFLLLVIFSSVCASKTCYQDRLWIPKSLNASQLPNPQRYSTWFWQQQLAQRPLEFRGLTDAHVDRRRRIQCLRSFSNATQIPRRSSSQKSGPGDDRGMAQ